MTPCLNAARFIEETIQSVLAQDYPNIEYIVLDGGSTDGTLEILEKYGRRLTFVSKPDRGASEAIQRGFDMSRGEIFAYLCADDTYHPGAIRRAVEHLQNHPEDAGVYGDAYWVREDGRTLGVYPTQDFDPETLAAMCYICQPTSFVRRHIFKNLGGLNTGLECSFDYDFWLRLGKQYRMGRVAGFLANSRMHRENKTLGRRHKVFRETIAALKRHRGYVPFQWIHGYAAYLIDGRDQFFDPLQPSFSKYVFSLLLGSYYNAGLFGRYLREWSSVMTLPAFRRRISDGWVRRTMEALSRPALW